MDPTARWRELLQRRVVPLDEAALLVSAHASPGLDVAAQLRRLDQLAGRVAAPKSTDAVVDLLFRRVGLLGDTATYTDPRNSYLDQVLDRRLGIPISLSILLIEVGRRCGLELEGVGMPGHFLVRDRADPDQLIDAFGGGRRLDPAACRALFDAVVGPGVAYDHSALAASGTRAILARVLANLDRSFRERGDLGGLGWVTTLRLAMPALPVALRVDLAATLGELGRCGEELAVLHDALALPELPAVLVAEIRRRMATAQSRLN
jgi:regulator of sirC expression with transglutaminase-like and TPR domain